MEMRTLILANNKRVTIGITVVSGIWSCVDFLLGDDKKMHYTSRSNRSMLRSSQLLVC